MSNDELERRINNKIEALVESQADLREAIADLLKVERIQNTRIEESRQQLVALIEVARSHDERLDHHNERLDRIDKQQAENSKQIAALIEQRKETREDMKQMQDAINALIRIVEGHISHHP